jgi:hypothetical protein
MLQSDKALRRLSISKESMPTNSETWLRGVRWETLLGEARRTDLVQVPVIRNLVYPEHDTRIFGRGV